jgi:hypothetical protein
MYRFEGCNSAPPIDDYGDLNPIPVEQRDVWLRCDTLKVIKQTPNGVWIVDRKGKKRMIRFNYNRQYAWHTKEEALTSFIARKERQIAILEAQSVQAEKFRQIAMKLQTPSHVIEKQWWESEW